MSIDKSSGPFSMVADATVLMLCGNFGASGSPPGVEGALAREAREPRWEAVASSVDSARRTGLSGRGRSATTMPSDSGNHSSNSSIIV